MATPSLDAMTTEDTRQPIDAVAPSKCSIYTPESFDVPFALTRRSP